MLWANIRQCDPGVIFYFLFSSLNFNQLHQVVSSDTETHDIFLMCLFYICILCILNVFMYFVFKYMFILY